MKLSNLFGLTNKDNKRVGRGIGSGKGKTAGRGTKGQLARTGKKIRPGFEGGQLPLAQRVPKMRGFKAISPKAITITMDQLNVLKSGTKVNAESLLKAGLISGLKEDYKIVAGKKYENSLVFDTDNMTAGAKKQAEKSAKPAKS